MFIKRAVTEASQEEPQWDSLKALLNDLESQTKRRRLSGTSQESSSPAQEAMPPGTGARKVPVKAPPSTKPRPVPAEPAPSSKPSTQGQHSPSASAHSGVASERQRGGVVDESERKRRKEEEAERRKREAEEHLRQERAATPAVRNTVKLDIAMSLERKFQTTPEGQPYETIGPRYYNGFKAGLDDYITGIEDYALPLRYSDAEVRYYNPEEEEHQFSEPRWASLKDHRNYDCTFEIRGVNHSDWNQWVYKDKYWSDSALYKGVSKELLESLSRQLVTCCRHRGCFDRGSTLGRDSGGWFVLYNLVKEVVNAPPYKNSWASRVQHLLASSKDCDERTVAKMLYLAIFPTKSYDKARFQVIIEVDSLGVDRRQRQMCIRDRATSCSQAVDFNDHLKSCFVVRLCW